MRVLEARQDLTVQSQKEERYFIDTDREVEM